MKIPTEFSEAVTAAQAAEWSEAITEERDAHMRNGMWIIISTDPSKVPIRFK